MAFQPEVNEELVIDGVSYRIGEHPVARGMPYGQEGRAAVVYLLVHGDDTDLSQRRALKVFKPRFREPGLVALSTRLAAYAGIPGLSVCKRTVLTPQSSDHARLIRQNPDLIYAVVMPWIDGPTWMEVLLDERELTPQQSLSLAHSLCSILNEMEKQGLAHCDLSGPNVLIPMLAHQPDPTQPFVSLVDVEQMYGLGLKKPTALPAGSSGYAHKTSPEGVWAGNADRFSGAVLLSEMLGWCDERVRKASWGENYFDPNEMQQENESYKILHSALKEQWGDGVAGLFENAWLSDTQVDCPTFAEWQAALAAVAQTSQDGPVLFVPLSSESPISGNGHSQESLPDLTEDVEADTLAVPAVALAALSPEHDAQPIDMPSTAEASHDAPTLAVPVPITSMPTPATEEAPKEDEGPKPQPRIRIGPTVLIPVALAVIMLFAGGFAVLQAQLGGSASNTNPNTNASANSTATAQALLSLAATQTAQANANATATALALANRYPGAISPATVGQIKLLGVLQGHTGPVLSVAVSPDGILLASASADGTVRVWKRSNGETLRILSAQQGPVTTVSFSPDSKTLLTASSDKTLRFWNTSGISAVTTASAPPVVTTPDRVINLSDSIQEALYAYLKDRIAVATNTDIQVYDPQGGTSTPVATLPASGGLVRHVRFAPDDETIASGAQDGTLRIWRISDSIVLNEIHDLTGAINSLAFSPDSLFFAAASGDGAINVYSAKNAALIHKLKAHTKAVNTIAFSPDGQTLASGGADNTVRLWNLHDGSLMRTLDTPAAINSLAFSPDGTELIAGSQDNTVMIWGTDASTLEASPTAQPTTTGTTVPTPTETPTSLPSATATTVSSGPLSAGASPTATNPAKASPTRTGTRTPTPRSTATRTPAVHATSTPTRPALTATRTRTPLRTATRTAVPATHTHTPMPLTSTPTQTPPAHTPTPSLTAIPPTHTIVPATGTPTQTPRPTDTPQRPTDTPRPTNTPRPPTNTPVPPTNTRVPTNTYTPRPTNTRPVPTGVITHEPGFGPDACDPNN